MPRIRRLTRTAACLLLFIALLQYRSFENTPIAGRWSYPYAAVLMVLGLLLAASLVAFLLPVGRRAARRASPQFWYFELALLLWSAARLISAVDDSTSAGSLLDLVFIGSWTPAAVLLDWSALAVGSFACGVTVWPRSRRWKKVALLGGSTVMFFLIAEGVARGKAILLPEPQGFPTLSGKIWSRRYVKLNGHGFRDREQASSPASDVRRILVIGDSIAHGVGINDPNGRFGERLASILRNRTCVDWELTTAARPDTHTLHHLKFLTTMLPRNPDVVVLVYVFNDIDYLAAVTIRDPLTEVPASIIRRFNVIRVLYMNSYFFNELFVRIRLLYYEYLHRGPVAPQSMWKTASPYFTNSVLDRHLEDLKGFVASASQSGSIVRIVPFDASVAFLSDSRTQYRHFVEAARRVDLPVLSIESAFDGFRREQLTINALDTHPNERAHGLAAEAAAAKLVDSIAQDKTRRLSRGLTTEVSRERIAAPAPSSVGR